MKKIILSFTIVLALFTACKKSSSTPNTTTTPSSSAYFIEGKVNGVMHHCEYKCTLPGCDMSSGNFDAFMQSITMQRTTSATSDIGWDLELSEVDLDTWHIPDTLNCSSMSGKVLLQISYYTGPWQSNTNYMNDGVILGDNSFKMYVTSKTGDVLQGTFSGELRNGSNTNDTLAVTEGKFKIKLIRI